MSGRIDNLLPTVQQAANALPGGGGHARAPVDMRATGKALSVAQPYFVQFPNGSAQHFDGQNMYGGMSKVGNPYVSSDDHLLATALSNNLQLPVLDQFKEDGHLTQQSMQKIASEDPGTSAVPERVIMLFRETVNRPRLNQAVLGKDRHLTAESLSTAAGSLVGNTNPNTQSADPYHAKTDLQLVQAFRAMFDDIRDTSEDYSFFFEKHRYVKKDTILEMSKDPDETDKNGQTVRDPATGFPKKKYSENQVYITKNLVERGLLDSLDSNKANGTSIFGSHNHDGWIKNYSVDRWMENEKKEKGL
ncbi:hypothetical protein [Pseudomonas cyclaminis]|nr:hypothetical protein [Pseudomonas cyclaminis]